jgi:two-component system chemotaxis response regulator CheB
MDDQLQPQLQPCTLISDAGHAWPGAAEAQRLAGVRLVAIGTSAGGVEALGLLLRALPPRCRAAVAIVLHIPPDRASLLPRLYAGRCALPLKEVEDKETIEAGTVYFAAPDYHMQVEPGRSFSLSMEEAVHFSRPSIDVMLETAAEVYGSALLGIILTGASDDGAAGLAAVRRAGGQAWVQDPAGASAAIMPAAAIARAGADRIISLQEIAAGLAALATA